MSGKDRINIFPSRGAQTIMKGRLKAAEKGHKLLKSKADALQMRFREGSISQTLQLLFQLWHFYSKFYQMWHLGNLEKIVSIVLKSLKFD